MWVLVRIAGIIVGIATLLRLATTQGLVTYDPLFQEWMNRLQDIVELGFLTDLIEPLLHRFIDWVRSFGWHLPDLNENWRPVFVLAGLYCGAVARNESWNRDRAVMIVGALFSAIGGALVAGLSGSIGILAGVLVAIALLDILDSLLFQIWSIRFRIEGLDERIPFTFRFSLFIPLLSLSTGAIFPNMSPLVILAAGYYLFQAISYPSAFSFMRNLFLAGSLVAVTLNLSEDANTFSLIAITLFIFLNGTFYLWRGVASLLQAAGESFEESASNGSQEYISFELREGLDILSVLLGSLFIASIFASPPIW